MAERRGPTDGARYKRAEPTRGNALENRKQPHPNGPKMNRRNGQTLWTQELQDKIIGLVEAGNYIEVAARACGIDNSTFQKWLYRGGRGEKPFTDLVGALERARARSEARDVALIAKAGETQWQASAWRLERKNFKRWGRKDHLQISGDSDNPLQILNTRIDLKLLTEEELALLVRLREKVRLNDASAQPLLEAENPSDE